MGRAGALLSGLLLALLAGCATQQAARPGALAERLRGPQALPPDAVQMEVAIIERPLGDPYLNKELWTFTDEQVVDLERRAALDENGFRVGQVVGMTPSGLQALLTSERSCLNPRRYLLASGRSATVVLGPVVAHRQFEVVQDGNTAELTLDQAQFGMVVVLTLTADGRTRLHLTPQVEYGENLPDFRVAPDGSGYMMEIKRPCKTFAALSWDVTLAPNQFLLLGTRLDQPQKLGGQAFLQPDTPAPVQRLLVVRTNRAPVATDEDDGTDALRDGHVSNRPPPLALQATWTARGSRPP
jgi:hypothetical protein